ncbi:MAG: hypothetical protein U1F25_06990 [Rubrivivax sp.]
MNATARAAKGCAAGAARTCGAEQRRILAARVLTRKLANVALARTREAELLHRLEPLRYPAPPRAAQAGQFKGVAVTAGR